MNSMPLRLLLDHNVGRGVALALRQAGLDVLFVGDIDPHIPDAAILRWAVHEQRLIVTQDLDFGTLVYHSRHPHAGVLLLRMASSHRDERTDAILWIIEHYGSQLPGKFTVFESGRLRIRE
jgi:predicted nuclease of predicted toxin-antitoxin system